mmetsp:Transcript_16869/g.51967  ORF Transcript_16869/g.51967 Transcript_16869/m.51967 type:complete len:259 (+) Transcript_16869:194-970(+)
MSPRQVRMSHARNQSPRHPFPSPRPSLSPRLRLQRPNLSLSPSLNPSLSQSLSLNPSPHQPSDPSLHRLSNPSALLPSRRRTQGWGVPQPGTTQAPRTQTLLTGSPRRWRRPPSRKLRRSPACTNQGLRLQRLPTPWRSRSRTRPTGKPSGTRDTAQCTTGTPRPMKAPGIRPQALHPRVLRPTLRARLCPHPARRASSSSSVGTRDPLLLQPGRVRTTGRATAPTWSASGSGQLTTRPQSSEPLDALIFFLVITHWR